MDVETKDKLTKQLKNYRPLVINRIPQNIKKEFEKLAEEEFCDDYGFCLTVLLEAYKRDWKFEVLYNMLESLGNTTTQPEEKKIKTNSGRVIERRGE